MQSYTTLCCAVCSKWEPVVQACTCRPVFLPPAAAAAAAATIGGMNVHMSLKILQSANQLADVVNTKAA